MADYFSSSILNAGLNRQRQGSVSDADVMIF